jgi:hypothetical protein
MKYNGAHRNARQVEIRYFGTIFYTLLEQHRLCVNIRSMRRSDLLEVTSNTRITASPVPDLARYLSAMAVKDPSPPSEYHL